MRAFVAIDPGQDACAALEGIQATLPAGRPVPPENLHLTLAFLGEQDPDALEALHDELDTIRAAPFTLHLTNIGSFGGAQPAVLFADVKPSEALSHLQQSVLRATRRAGIQIDRRRFRPHVTLARLKSAPTDRVGLWAAAQGALDIAFPVADFGLYQSELHRDGAIHTELARYVL